MRSITKGIPVQIRPEKKTITTFVHCTIITEVLQGSGQAWAPENLMYLSDNVGSKVSKDIPKGRRQKNTGKSGQADRFGGVTPLQPDRFYFVKILTHFVHYKMAK